MTMNIIILAIMEERRNMENPSRATMRVLKSMNWIATHTRREGLTARDLVTEYEEANGFRYCTESRESIARLYERIYGESRKIQNSTAYGVMNGRVLK